MKHPALFLDRDGTINYDPGYISDPKQVKLYPGICEGIKKIKQALGFKVIVVSNQSGIARGLMTHEDVQLVNSKINDLLAEFRTSVDAFYYCPYHPDFNEKSLCTCRKPSPEMIFRAAEELNIDLKRSYMIGDKASDVECGFNAGIKSILFLNESNSDEINVLKYGGKTPNFVADNFLQACDFIINDFTEAHS